jgi:nicotinamide riboside kinase
MNPTRATNGTADSTSDLENLRFDRHFRTPYSEGYHVFRGENRLATVDLHFTSTTVHCTLILEQDLDRPAIARLIERIDEDLVLSADTPRDDLLVNVYRGSEVGFFTDTFHADEDELVAQLGDEAGDDEDDEFGF